MIFPMESSEFTKSLNFGSISKNKIVETKPTIFYLKWIFMENKIFFLIKTGCSLIDFNVIIPMQSSEFTKSMNFASILKRVHNKKPDR